MRRKIISLLMSILLINVSIMSVGGMGGIIRAESIELQDEIISEERLSGTVITNALSSYMQNLRSGTVSVTIQISDEVDLEIIDKKALENLDITTEQLEKMEEYGYTLSDEENISYQQKLLAVYDEIRAERNRLLKEHYSKVNGEFIEGMGWTEADYGSVGIFTPFVRNVNIPVEEVYALAESGMVDMIDIYKNDVYDTYAVQNETYSASTTTPSVEETIAIIRGNVAVNNGYRGSGVKVGMIEQGLPRTPIMGTDANNVNWVNYTSASQLSDHATMVCGIIKKMAPDCTVYSYCSSSQEDTVNTCQALIDTYNVQVINLSVGAATYNGQYNAYSVELDTIVKNNNVTIVAAAGNYREYNGYIIDDYDISDFAIAPNVISVGSVKSSGTSQSAEGAYELSELSCYIEGVGTVNKPEICAPGSLSIYSSITYNEAYTSFATPHVTGTVVQMISRNAGMSTKPTIMKAAVMASATYGTADRGQDKPTGLFIDDKEGAGVVDAGFCYDVARNGRRAHYVIPYDETSWSYNVYCDYTDVPLRIACTWDVNSYLENNVIFNDYDITIYKNGIPIERTASRNAGSTGENTNYEVIELGVSKIAYWGAGYYEVRVERYGNAQSSGFHTLGLAWEQP